MRFESPATVVSIELAVNGAKSKFPDGINWKILLEYLVEKMGDSVSTGAICADEN